MSTKDMRIMGKNSALSIILIVLGLLMILGQFFDLDFGDSISTWWPMIMVLGGLYYLGQPEESLYTGLVLTAAGVSFQLSKLDITDSFWSLFLPLLLIILGVFFAKGSKNKQKQAEHSDDYNYEKAPGKNRGGIGQHQSSASNSLNHDISAAFSSTQKKIDDKEFTYCSISSVFASCEVDLRDCVALGSSVDLNLRAIMGNVEIMVPSNWQLAINGSPVLGNFEDRTRGARETEGRPIVQCTVSVECIMGNIEIRD